MAQPTTALAVPDDDRPDRPDPVATSAAWLAATLPGDPVEETTGHAEAVATFLRDLVTDADQVPTAPCTPAEATAYLLGQRLGKQRDPAEVATRLGEAQAVLRGLRAGIVEETGSDLRLVARHELALTAGEWFLDGIRDVLGGAGPMFEPDDDPGDEDVDEQDRITDDPYLAVTRSQYRAALVDAFRRGAKAADPGGVRIFGIRISREARS